MLASDRNRGARRVANPAHDDGFNTARKFKARGNSGRSGNRLIRRRLRRAEARAWRSAL